LETDDKEKNESQDLVEIKADYDKDDQEKTKHHVYDGDCQISLETSVWKSAKYCARKFENIDFEKKKQYFSTYCNREIKNVLQSKCEPLPTSERLISIQKKMDVFETFYQKTDDKTESIFQVDGNDDIMDEEVPPKCLYSVNCEHPVLISWINFFRSFDFLWETTDHCICTFNVADPGLSSCFFCLMRSSCIRLRIRVAKRTKELKTI
jgi:hypothetical protein